MFRLTLRCLIAKIWPFQLQVDSEQSNNDEGSLSVYFDYPEGDWRVEELRHEIRIDTRGKVYLMIDGEWELQDDVIGIQFRRGE